MLAPGTGRFRRTARKLAGDHLRLWGVAQTGEHINVNILTSRISSLAFGLLAATCWLGVQPPVTRFPPPAAKPRIIATTDGEIDDRCSMIRLLMYANEFKSKV